jgi:hypothetical protein
MKQGSLIAWRHCEERRDEAIQERRGTGLPRQLSLARNDGNLG